PDRATPFDALIIRHQEERNTLVSLLRGRPKEVGLDLLSYLPQRCTLSGRVGVGLTLRQYLVHDFLRCRGLASGQELRRPRANRTTEMRRERHGVGVPRQTAAHGINDHLVHEVVLFEVDADSGLSENERPLPSVAEHHL